MTKIVNGVLIISEETDDVCSRCGKKAELRPYGKNGARICFECGMKDEETTKKEMNKLFDKMTYQNPNNN